MPGIAGCGYCGGRSLSRQLRLRGSAMCRNIKILFNFEPPVTEAEIHAAALQFVRRSAGSTSRRRRMKRLFRRPWRRSRRLPIGCCARSKPTHRRRIGRTRPPRPAPATPSGSRSESPGSVGAPGHASTAGHAGAAGDVALSITHRHRSHSPIERRSTKALPSLHAADQSTVYADYVARHVGGLRTREKGRHRCELGRFSVAPGRNRGA